MPTTKFSGKDTVTYHTLARPIKFTTVCRTCGTELFNQNSPIVPSSVVIAIHYENLNKSDRLLALVDRAAPCTCGGTRYSIQQMSIREAQLEASIIRKMIKVFKSVPDGIQFVELPSNNK